MSFDRQAPPGKRFVNPVEEQLLKIVETSLIDSMTGLPNRRAFDISLKQLQTHPSPITILFLDLDRLKPINDKYGHKAGDKLLLSIGKVDFSPLPKHSLYRIGGDEFAFILPKEGSTIPTDLVTTSIEQVNIAITKHNQNLPKDDFPISVSIGGAVSTDNSNHNLGAICEKADHQMYIEKNKKRRLLYKLKSALIHLMNSK